MNKNTRSSGIILHPTSLPGQDGIGDFGYFAYRWIDFLSSTGCDIWQVLPLGPTGYGDSPYQCFSAFAGNPYLISPALLLEDELLTRSDLLDRPDFPVSSIDYGTVINWKVKILKQAYTQFKNNKNHPFHQNFTQFIENEKSWLLDYSMFMAIKSTMGGKPWNQWSPGLKFRYPDAITQFEKDHSDEIQQVAFSQFLFFAQWNNLKTYANKKKIQILGDVPIFVAFDSADVWAHPDLFYLDDEGNPTVVAGVPPDYFSPTGQLWGNPLYRWDYLKKKDYSWWIERMKATLQLFDLIRMDHFRGFAGYWEVPSGMKTAEKGRWVPGPGLDFFNVLNQYIGNMQILAEDLGEITPDVIALRDTLGLPGMKILQFAFSEGPENNFLPHMFDRNCIAYTGTHDNDTTLGWFSSIPPKEVDFTLRYLGCSKEDIVPAMIRAVWGSVARYAIAPMQDFLNLDSTARMNYPGRSSGNWCWRMSADDFSRQIEEKIASLNCTFGRGNYRDIVTKPEPMMIGTIPDLSQEDGDGDREAM